MTQFSTLSIIYCCAWSRYIGQQLSVYYKIVIENLKRGDKTEVKAFYNSKAGSEEQSHDF